MNEETCPSTCTCLPKLFTRSYPFSSHTAQITNTNKYEKVGNVGPKITQTRVVGVVSCGFHLIKKILAIAKGKIRQTKPPGGIDNYYNCT